MRDHLIDIRLQPTAEAVGTDATRASSVAAQHREALTAALGEDFSQRCASSMSIAQIDCVLDAEDSEAIAACSAPR